MRSVWLVVVSCALACGAKTAAPTAPDPRADAIAAAASSWLGRSPAPGVQVAVIDDGKVVVEQGFGLADREAPRPVASSTVFRLGSITQSFTAAAILRLVDAGRVRLDDPITKYLTDYPTPSAAITLRHLLGHTSGIPDYVDLPELQARAGEAIPARELIAMFTAAPLEVEPGARFASSSSGYYLLGIVLELITGEPYSDAIHHLVAAPESLVTSYCPDRPGEDDAQDYTFRDAIVRAEPISMANPYAAGALCGTAGDVARFFRALARGLIAGRTFDAMTTRTVAGGRPVDHGLGVEIDEFEGHRRIGHGGTISGFASRVWYYPEDDLAVVVLANSDAIGVDGLVDPLSRIALGLPPLELGAQPLDDGARFEGLYQFEGSAQRFALDDDGRLTIADVHDDGTSGWPRPLAHVGGGRFVDADGGPTIVTFPPSEGPPPTVTLARADRRAEGARIEVKRPVAPPTPQDAGPTDATP